MHSSKVTSHFHLWLSFYLTWLHVKNAFCVWCSSCMLNYLTLLDLMIISCCWIFLFAKLQRTSSVIRRWMYFIFVFLVDLIPWIFLCISNLFYCSVRRLLITHWVCFWSWHLGLNFSIFIKIIKFSLLRCNVFHTQALYFFAVIWLENYFSSWIQ